MKEEFRAGARISCRSKICCRMCASRSAACAARRASPLFVVDHPGAGDRHDLGDIQHGGWADFQAVPGAASGQHCHSGRHHARQQLRRFFLPRISGHPRQNEKLRRRDRQRRYAGCRLQRRTRRHAANQRRHDGFGQLSSACSASSRASAAAFAKTKTWCPAATPSWCSARISGNANSRAILPSSAAPFA